MKYLKLLTLFLLTWLANFALAPEASAKEESKTVRVGYFYANRLQEGMSDDAQKEGYAYIYLQYISYFGGWKYEYVYGSFKQLYEMLLAGEIDVMPATFYFADRTDKILYPRAVMGNYEYFICKHREDDRLHASDINTLTKARIGTVTNNRMTSYLKDWIKKTGVDVEVVGYGSFGEMYADFDDNKIDAVVKSEYDPQPKSHTNRLYWVGDNPYYLGVSIKRRDLLDDVNHAMDVITEIAPSMLSNLEHSYVTGDPISELSSQELNWVKNHRQFRLGYMNNYLPFCTQDEKGELTGLLSDVVPYMLEKLGLGADAISRIDQIAYDNLEQMVADLKSGQLDAIFPVGGDLWLAEKNSYYITSPLVTANVALTFKGDYSEKKLKSISVNKHNMLQYNYTIEHFPDARIVLCESAEDCIAAVADGRAESTLLNGLRANDLLKKANYGNTLSYIILSQSDTFRFAVADGNNTLLQILNRGITAIGAEYGINTAHRYSLFNYSIDDFLHDNAIYIIIILVWVFLIVVFFVVRNMRKERLYNRRLAQHNAQLEEARTAAEEASQAKSRFLGNMTHDIRTPMNAIVGFTHLAESNMDNPGQVKEYLCKIKTSSKHLLSLVNDILDMESIESGKIELDEQNENLQAMVDEVCTILGEGARYKEQQFSAKVLQLEHPWVKCDMLRLKQIVINIVGNAIKYTPIGGKIDLTLTELAAQEGTSDRGVYQICVSDTGQGMSPEYLEHIFEQFTRERNTTHSRIQGTGLGMAITKALVDKMQGKIEVQSEVGKGSVFTVTLPFSYGEEEIAATTESLHASQEEGKSHNILLVEDNEINQEIAVSILEELGETVTVANHGQEAVDMLLQQPAGTYDVVFMDLQMPVMDGFEATRRIRAFDDKEKANIPIYAMTANAFAEDKQKTQEVGMNGHLSKPIDMQELVKVLKQL